MAHKRYEGPHGLVEAWPEDEEVDGGTVAGVGFRSPDRKQRGWMSREDFAASHTGEERSSLAPPYHEKEAAHG